MKKLYDHIWSDFFKEPIDDMPASGKEIRFRLKGVLLQGEWYEAYDLVQFIINSPKHGRRDHFVSDVMRILTEEQAGFRLMNNQLVEITDEAEIAAIEDSLVITQADRFAHVRAHLVTALELLSDRRAPDYRNSMKESISGVEAVVQTIRLSSRTWKSA